MEEVEPPLNPSAHKANTSSSPISRRSVQSVMTDPPTPPWVRKRRANVINYHSPNLQSSNLLISFPTALFLALILPVFAIAPLFYPGYFQTHSGFVPLWNVADLRANFDAFDWLPHIAVTFDPLRSEGLLPYYLAGLLPVPPVVAVKGIMGLGLLLGSLGMFLWLRSWLGHPGALVSALVYTYLPHQIATIYIRGAWGETVFWGLLPWAILAATYLIGIEIFRDLKTLKVLAVPLTMFFWLLLGLSQLGLALWACLFLVLLLLTVHLSKSLLSIISALIGLAIAAFISLRLASISAPPVPFDDHFLYPSQLFSAYWGFGASRPGWNDGLPLQLGLAAVGLTMLTVILWQRQLGRIMSRTDRRFWFFLGTALVLIPMQLGLASFVWDLPLLAGAPLSSTLTYPWQLLGLTGFCLAVLAGAALWLDEQLTRPSLFAAIVFFVVLSSYSYLAPQFTQADYGGPEALLGQDQLVLLEHDFASMTSGNTAGLSLSETTTIPLALQGPLQANDTLLVNVVWQPLQTFGNDLKIFIHLVDPNNNVIAQFDGQPQQGDYPTSRWVPGELVEDTYSVFLPETLPPGPYRVFVGLYDEATFTRLPVATDIEGRVILDVE